MTDEVQTKALEGIESVEEGKQSVERKTEAVTRAVAGEPTDDEQRRFNEVDN